MAWNYDMDSCPLDTEVRLLSEAGNPLLPQHAFIGTITHNGRGICRAGDPDYFYRSKLVAWQPIYKNEGVNYMSLSEAVDILKKDKDAMQLVIALGNGNDKMQASADAMAIVLAWVDKMYSAFIMIGK